MPRATGTVFLRPRPCRPASLLLIRNSTDYAGWKDRKALAAAIKPIYTPPPQCRGRRRPELDAFEHSDWAKFPTVG
jgi:transposase-like protein